MAIFEFPVQNVALASSLSAMQAVLGDLRPFWPQARTLFGEWMNRQFDSEGAWGGDPWAPLTPNYAANKMARYPGRSTLVATRALHDAAIAPRIVESGFHTLSLAIDDAPIRASRPDYAGHAQRDVAVASFHQDGTRHMPRRPLIPDEWPAEAEDELREKLEVYLVRMAARLGLI